MFLTCAGVLAWLVLGRQDVPYLCVFSDESGQKRVMTPGKMERGSKEQRTALKKYCWLLNHS